MSPRQLENAANSLRPCSILEDHPQVEPESDNEESERENEEAESESDSRGSDSDSERGEEIGSKQEVVGVNEEEVGGGVAEEGEVELVVEFGVGETEEDSRSALLSRLVKRKRERGCRERRSRHHRDTPGMMQSYHIPTYNYI